MSTGQPTIEASHLMWAVSATPSPEMAAAVRRDAQAVKAALSDWHASYGYYNAVEVAAPASAVLPAVSHSRLQKIKARYDPDQVIISSHPVRAAA